MNNVNVKRNNYYKFKHYSRCGCMECNYKYGNVSRVAKDYITEEELMDEDGWI